MADRKALAEWCDREAQYLEEIAGEGRGSEAEYLADRVAKFRAVLALLREEREPVASFTVDHRKLVQFRDIVAASDEIPPGTYHVYRAEEPESDG